MEKNRVVPRKIIVVDDEVKMQRIVQIMLSKMGHEAVLAGTAEEALAHMERERADLILTDMKMPSMSGIDLLRAAKKVNKDVPVIIMTAYGTVRNAVDAIKKGASDYILKPFDMDEMEMAITRALEVVDAKKEIYYLKEELEGRFPYENMVGRSLSMAKIFKLIDKVGPSDASVLIYGDTGTGKELLARAIHNKSPRRDRLFVAVNCAAIPGSLLESELFGHVKGAFTGAYTDTAGRFQRAHGGSIFFDEIGDMDPALQAKLLRVLQEKEFEKVGSTVSQKVDVRVIAATNKDLKELMREGKFREDLYYRLNVVAIEVPSLSERVDDIPLLIEHFLAKYSREIGKHISGVSPAAVASMTEYEWPGNVRELENIIERAVALSTTEMIGEDDIPSEILSPGRKGPSSMDIETEVRKLEKRMIQDALGMSGGVKARAARVLGISERNLWYKLKKYSL